jgi:hypothetical protein
VGLIKPILHPNGIVTNYTRIERVMVNYSGEGSIEVVVNEYVDQSIRERLKAGEMLSAYGERNYYLTLGDQNCDRANLYPRLKAEVPELAGAEDA